VALPVVLTAVPGPTILAVPSGPMLAQWLRDPLTSPTIAGVTIAAVWGMWLLLFVTVVPSVIRTVLRPFRYTTPAPPGPRPARNTAAAVRGGRRRWAAMTLPGPHRGLAAAMIGTAAVSSAVTAAHAAPAAQPTDTAPADRDRPEADPRPAEADGDPAADAPVAARQDPPNTGPQRGPHHRTVASDRHPPAVTVRPGDTLYDLADAWLDDPGRWPDIYDLNRGTRFTTPGGTLTDPHLIRPGWTLRLPADVARPNTQPNAPPAASSPPAPPKAVAPAPLPTTAPTSSPRAASRAPAGPTTPISCAPAPAASGHDGTDDGVAAAVPPGVPTTTAPAAPTPPPTPSRSPRTGTPAAASSPPTTTAPAGHTDRDRAPGVSLRSGSWVDAGLAAAVAAAVALVWAHRRRRYTPRSLAAALRTDDLDLAPMPSTVVEVSRGLRRLPPADPADSGLDDLLTDAAAGAEDEAGDMEPDGGRQPDTVGAAPVVPALVHPLAQVWPPAGVGLTGPGATAAARGFLAAGLATGGIDDPDQRTHVIMPSATAATLLGTHAVALPTTPRLTVTAGLDDALDLIDTHTLHRARLAYQHETDDVAALRAADPTEDLPPILLIADITSRHERARVAALLTQGQRLDIHGVLLGTWPDGNTIHVHHDGTSQPADTYDCGRHGTHPADVGRLTVLDPTETADIVATLAESHTGRPQRPAPTEPPTTTEPAADRPAGTVTEAAAAPPSDSAEPEVASTPVHAGTAHDLEPVTDAATDHPVPEPDSQESGQPDDHRNAEDQDDQDEDAAAAADADGPGGPVVVAVLGGATIIGADPQRKPRPQALELLVYLAVHDGTATVDAILEDLLPDALARKAARRLHTYVSDLRGVLRHNGGPGVYVTHPKLRYALNPDTVDIDLWRMRAAITTATRADTPEQRITALRAAVDCYRGPLADGYDYLWVEAHREAVRRQALDATTALVDALNGQPEEQLAVLEAAIALHPWAEHLYQAAIRAHHRLGHVGAIRDLRRAAIAAAADLDAEPGDDTIALADELVADLQTRARRAPLRPHPGATP
jgi:DNA-binding SARP family transcriptional activator